MLIVVDLPALDTRTIITMRACERSSIAAPIRPEEAKAFANIDAHGKIVHRHLVYLATLEQRAIRKVGTGRERGCRDAHGKPYASF